MKKLLLFAMMLMVSAVVIAQDSIPVLVNPFPGIDLQNFPYDKIISLENGVYSALLILLSYLSFAIPGVKKIPVKAVRVIVIASVLAFVYFGYKITTDSFNVNAFISVLINYLISTNVYDKLLRPLGGRTVS